MNEKRSFGDQLEVFFEGKGFYIVLFMCAAVIGVSAWVLMAGTDVDEIGDVGTAGVVVTPEIVSTPLPTISQAPQISTVVETAPAVLPEKEDTAQVWNENTESDNSLFVWPVNGKVITPYAMTSLIYDRTMEDWRAHGGIDIQAALGEHVAAVASGKVTSVISDAMYGTTVIIEHSGGVESIYSNLASQPTVYEGDTVKPGQVIGAIGKTAICESALGDHLHFSMRLDGASADPAAYLP